MSSISRRRFLQLSTLAGGMALAGGALPTGGMLHHVLERAWGTNRAWAADAPKGDPIKIGIIDPLSSPYKTSSIHDVHGARVAIDMYNKRGGVLGRPVALLEEVDDASNPQTAVKAATKLIKDDGVDFLMGTFNGDVSLAVAEVARSQNRLFMVTGAHIMELTGSKCNPHTFVFMPNARMMAQAVAPHISKAYGNRWYTITADTVDGKAALQAMSEAHRAQGGEIVGGATTPFGTTDFTAALT